MTEKRGKKKIVSFDLDMTLLDHKNWEIPGSAMEAIERLRKNHIIVIASGRNMDNNLSYMYRDMIQPDAVIHMNGTRVEADGKVLYEHLMDKERLRRLLSYAQEHQISIGASIDGRDYYMNPQVVAARDEVLWGISERDFRNPWELMDMPVRTLAYIGGKEQLKGLQAEFPDINFFMFSGNTGADVVEQEASKARGLKRLCDYYGIDISQTVAFGDSMNDCEIVKAAGIGVAMGNAMEELKAEADYVTDDIDKDGVWNACVHLGLIE